MHARAALRPRPRCVWLARGSLPGAGRGRPCGRPAWLAGWLAGGEEGRSRRVDGARTINYAAPMSRQTKSMFVHSEGFSEHGPRSHQTPTRPLTEINKSVRTRAPSLGYLSLPPSHRPTETGTPARHPASRTPNEAPRTDSKIPAAPSMGLTNPEPYAAVAPLGPAARTSQPHARRRLAVALQRAGYMHMDMYMYMSCTCGCAPASRTCPAVD